MHISELLSITHHPCAAHFLDSENTSALYHEKARNSWASESREGQMGRALRERLCQCPSPTKQNSPDVLGLQSSVQAVRRSGGGEWASRRRSGCPERMRPAMGPSLRPHQEEEPGGMEESQFLDISSDQGQRPVIEMQC